MFECVLRPRVSWDVPLNEAEMIFHTSLVRLFCREVKTFAAASFKRVIRCSRRLSRCPPEALGRSKNKTRSAVLRSAARQTKGANHPVQTVYFFYKLGNYDLLCNSLYNTTYGNQKKQIKLYKAASGHK